jgi:hypothetical protein
MLEAVKLKDMLSDEEFTIFANQLNALTLINNTLVSTTTTFDWISNNKIIKVLQEYSFNLNHYNAIIQLLKNSFEAPQAPYKPLK